MAGLKGKFSISKAMEGMSLSSKIRTLLIMTLLPMIMLMAICLYAMFSNSARYDRIAQNIILASDFNSDFKMRVDSNAYKYITFKYSKDFESFKILEDIDEAHDLINRLSETTTHPESKKRLEWVSRDLVNLRKRILELRDIESMDMLFSEYGEAEVMLSEEAKEQRESWTLSNYLEERLDRFVRPLTEVIQSNFWEYIHYEAAYLAEMHVQINKEVARIIALLAALAVGLLVFVFIVAVRISSSITKPIQLLSENIRTVGKGDFTVRPIEADTDEVRTLSSAFDGMVEQIVALMENVRQEQHNLRKAEFKILQEQINPHFLYNTFDTVIWLAEDNQNEKVIGMITSLSNFFRTSLSSGRDIITIKEETLHIRSYLEIQQVRYADILTFEIDIPPEMAACTIPKLTLQPLVENALYHGLKQKRSVGLIRINGSIEGDMIKLTVWDNGIGIQPKQLAAIEDALDGKGERTSVGLHNVHERLQLYYGKQHTMAIDSVYGEYTKVDIFIPSKENQQLSKNI